jgi:cytochrome c oxidase subunit 3
MTVNTEAVSETTERYVYKATNNRLGLWLFILSDSFVFGGLLVARFFLLGMERPELNQALGLIVTAILLVSSFFMNRAETAIAAGDMDRFFRSMLATLALGLIFLVGVVGVEWQIAPFGPGDGTVGGVFYMMTGMHALHVLSGVLFIAIIYRNARKGLYSPERHFPVEACAVYWHFVDVVWVFFYPSLYLIGMVAG